MERTLNSLGDDAGVAFNSSRPKSAASWGAIFAGALVAVAVSLVLLTLGAHGASQGAMAGSRSSPMGYGVDKLFRPSPGTAAGSEQNPADMHAEAMRIMANAMETGAVPDADRSYLIGLVSARTGMSDAEAQKRVDDFIAGANEAEAKIKAKADVARKDAAEVSIYTALSMLIGAFIASVAAALGGRLRDEHV